MENLKSLLKILLSSDIDFVIIGGFAGIVHGSSMVTRDIDICAKIDETAVAKLRLALRDLKPVHRMNLTANISFLDSPRDNRDLNNIYLKTTLGVLDILSEVPPAGKFASIKERSIEVSIYGYKCRIICIEDLIKIKRSMKRPKDLQMLAELKAIHSKNVSKK
jgi:predicted nucleotidyltransferase